MYEDGSGVDDAEYHIMYDHYDDHIKLPHEAPPATALKLATVVHQDPGPHPSLSNGQALTTVTLSPGEALVSPSLGNNLLSATTALTTTSSLTQEVRLTASSLSPETESLGGTPLSVSSAIPTATLTADNDFATTTISDNDSLSVAAMSDVHSSVHNRVSELDVNEVVSTSGEGVIDSNLVTSSSIDAVVTSMVASSDCGGVSANSRKLPSQFVVKLFGDDSLSLDMVRIIAEQEPELASSPQPHGLSMLTRAGTLVHTKLTDNNIISGLTSNQYRPAEMLRPAIRTDVDDNTPCSVVWTCALCHLAFTSSEAVGEHQEKDCTENPNGDPLSTTTSQATVDALMSPVHQQEETTYELKIERGDPQRNDAEVQGILNLETLQEKEAEVAECETSWSCEVCNADFAESKELSRHHLTHSLEELSSALMKFTKPHQKTRTKAVAKTETMSPVTTANVATAPMVESDCNWNNVDTTTTAATKLEEEIVDDPGDTPPQTPPQIGSMEKKKKPGPKAKPREKSEKRKYVRKLGEDGKPIRQREYKLPPPGHGSRDPHTCYVCNKVLSSRGNLAKHLVLHTMDKPFVCELCGLGFNSKRDQNHHYLQHHTKERPNICEVCGKGYVDSRYLSEHMVFHRQERPYSCEICGKFFLTAKCVARHRKRHEKEKHFTCSICFKSFAVKVDLHSHMRKVHRNNKKAAKIKQNQEAESQQVKAKDITEFLLPSSSPTHILPEQLLPSDLETTSLSGSVSGKDGIFISNETLTVPSIIPITAHNGGVNCSSYGLTLTTPAAAAGVAASAGDHTATYIMINNAEDEVAAPHTVPTTHALNILYTAAPTSNHQVGGEVDSSQLDEIQQLSSSVGTALVSSDGHLRAANTLHQHLDTGQETQHHSQHTSASLPTGGDETGLGGESHAPTELSLTTAPASGEAGGGGPPELSVVDATSHDHGAVNAAQDSGPGFHLELLSHAIALELQRSSQTSSSNYLG